MASYNHIQRDIDTAIREMNKRIRGYQYNTGYMGRRWVTTTLEQKKVLKRQIAQLQRARAWVHKARMTEWEARKK